MLTYDGKLTQLDPDDTYKLELEDSKRYVIELQGTGKNGLEDPFLIILGEGGEYAEDDDSGIDGASLIEFRPAKTQYYDITALAAVGTSLGAYTLTVKVDDYRDTFDGAARIGQLEPEGVVKTGRINEAGDVDLFEIRLVKGLNYNLRLDPGPKGGDYVGDPNLTLLSASGKTIASDDNSGTEDAAFIDVTPTRNGVHYLQAEAAGEDTGTYRLLASIGRASYQDDLIRGTKSADSISALSGDDEVSGREGDDRIWGANGDDQLQGGPGSDMIRGGDGADQIFGGIGQDILRGETGDDFADGGADNDEIYGGEGNDTLDGGAGADTIRGEAGDNYIRGEEDDDWLIGGDERDTLNGGDGRDQIYGNAGDDLISGGAYEDGLNGDDGNDTLNGGDSGDYLYGGGDDDELSGGTGDDYLNGGDGDDRLDGGSGADEYDGGNGNDVFIFSKAKHSTVLHTDGIYRFDKPGEKEGDLIDLSAIDGDRTATGQQSLSFDGSGSGDTGTLWLAASTKKFDSSIFIYANLDGDSEAELAIRLYNYEGRDVSKYSADDFVV
jgi:Ca2+-binding RTX toxin-like protein